MEDRVMDCVTPRAAVCHGCGHERFYHLGGAGCCLHVQPRGATQRRCVCAGYSGRAEATATPVVAVANRVNRLRAWVDAGVDAVTVRRELTEIAAMLKELGDK